MTPQELKNSILQLAIQGKLVKQCPEEGTGEQLYQQIQAEKQRLIKAGTIKKEKPLPEIAQDERPFDIPESWKWVRVGNIGSWNAGATPSRTNPHYFNGNVPWLKTGDLNDGYITEVPEFISESALKETSVQINPIGSVLMAMYGATIGKLGILSIKATTNQACCACYPVPHLFNKFLFYFLMANRKVFIKMGAGGAQPNISKEKIVNALMPLPPLAEQQRIVAKIEELLPYIDRYEQAWRKLEDFNKRFPTDMQKSILQMAIQGKLVEQRPEEGTGEELYQQIQAEKQRLIKAGTIRKEKALQEITEDEKPFDIPESWKWAKLGALFSIERGSSPRPIQAYLTSSQHGVNWIKIGDSETGGKYITATSEKITQEGAKMSRLVNIGDFIISNSMSFGRPYIMAINGYVHDGWNIIHNIKIKNGLEFNKEYLYHVLSSNLLVEQMQDKAAGGVVKNIRSDNLRELIIPIPPLAEQERIVAKLEEILPLCEKLKK